MSWRWSRSLFQSSIRLRVAWSAESQHGFTTSTPCASANASNPSSTASLGSLFQQRITPAVCSQLSANGYAVLDDVFPSPAALREEVLGLYRAGHMHDNCTHLVKDGVTRLLPKHHVHEAELTFNSNIQEKAPLCAQLNADRTLPIMLSLFMPQLQLDAQAIKLQVNSGQGGCFPAHFDTDEALDGRKVTCIFYLNPGWKEEDGGALRLYPFPQRPPIDIAPLDNRIVMFSSARMLHRVLPSRAQERVCFTIWLSQTRRQTARPPPSLSAAAAKAREQPGAAAAFLLSPPVRKHLLKLVYAEEWARSIEESHPAGPERDQAVERHWHEVEVIRKALGEHAPTVQAMTAAMLMQGKEAHPGGGPQLATGMRESLRVAWF